MSFSKFENECAGCRPALLDAETGKVLGPEHPVMRAINAVWENMTRTEREAFHRFTCLNSRTPGDLAVIKTMQLRFEEAAES